MGLRAGTFASYLRAVRPVVERALDARLPSTSTAPRALHRAMRYTVFSGGKRLRPAIVLLACEAFGGRRREALPAACAVEFLHTYSLIHDDLPSMDDDDFRRGRPTCHRRFGEATAILAGDALHTAAFAALAEAPRDAVADLVAVLARAAGSRGMVGGQVEDLAAEGARPALARVRSIHERKTAALLAASAECGAVCAGADGRGKAAARAFGVDLGLAFQVVDDVLDVVGERRSLGKTPGKDEDSSKMTYPACVGIGRAKDAARRLAARAERRARAWPAAARSLLVDLARFVVDRTH